MATGAGPASASLAMLAAAPRDSGHLAFVPNLILVRLLLHTFFSSSVIVFHRSPSALATPVIPKSGFAAATSLLTGEKNMYAERARRRVWILLGAFTLLTLGDFLIFSTVRRSRIRNRCRWVRPVGFASRAKSSSSSLVVPATYPSSSSSDASAMISSARALAPTLEMRTAWRSRS